jgi:hypothetical protein
LPSTSIGGTRGPVGSTFTANIVVNVDPDGVAPRPIDVHGANGTREAAEKTSVG